MVFDKELAKHYIGEAFTDFAKFTDNHIFLVRITLETITTCYLPPLLLHTNSGIDRATQSCMCLRALVPLALGGRHAPES